MRYLVCQPKGPLTKVRVMPSDGKVDQPFEVWALNTGPRILFVERGLGKLLERHHMGGNFQQGALYGLEFDEMVAVLQSKLGEHDRARYTRLLQEQEQFHAELRASRWPQMRLASAISWGIAKMICVIVWKTLVMLVFLCILPILIGVVRSMSRKH